MAADPRHLLLVLLFLTLTIMTSFSAHHSNSSRAIPPSEHHSALPPPVRPHPSGRLPLAPSPSSPVRPHPSGRRPLAPFPSSPVRPHPSGRRPSAPSPSSPVRPHHSGRRPPAPAPTPSPVRPHPSASASSSALDPKQLRALHSFEIPTAKDPCSPSPRAAVGCDSSKPYRHVLSLRLVNCSDDLSLSSTDLKSLATLTSLLFISCPIPPPRFPHVLLSSLRSFTAVHSLRKLTGVWLSRFQNLTDLTVSDVPVKASGPAIVVGKMKNLRSITISGANLTGSFPKKLHPNLTLIDLSANRLRGRIPSSLTLLDKLQSLNLSSNSLTGELPSSMGDLLALKTASFSSNSLSGRIPGSMSSLRSLTHLDLSSNQLNGTIPKFLTGMKSLKHLNLENNSFTGVLPFNSSFIKKMIVLKVGRNSDLCYNHSNLPSKLKLGIAPCDKHGLPESPPASKDSSPGGDDSDYNDSAGDETEKPKGRHHHGPNKVVLGVAIALAAIIFLIVFLILLSKWCA